MKSVVIMDDNGLHARPASEVVNIASKHNGDVYLVKDGVKCNAKSIMMVMGLGILKGDKIDIIAEGEDKERMEIEIVEIINNTNNK